MTSTDAPTFFDYCRSRIGELVDRHAGMGVVERTIDAYALDREEKDALWLWARGRRERIISETSERPTVGNTASP